MSTVEWFRAYLGPAARDLVLKIAGQTKSSTRSSCGRSFCSSCCRRRTIARGRKVARRASLEVKCIREGKARRLCKFGGAR